MKISVLLPSLFPPLAKRAIASLRQTSVPLEIICCGPERVPEADVFVEQQPSGVCAAQRACFKQATGELVMLFSDDVAMDEGWAEKVVPTFQRMGYGIEPSKFILNICSHPVCVCTCFGRMYANFPIFHRKLALPRPTPATPAGFPGVPGLNPDLGPSYLYSEWSDVALSMSVWEKGGVVKRFPEQLIRSPKDVGDEYEKLSREGRQAMDRLGCPPPTRNTFDSDCKSFIERFRPTIGQGWPLSSRWWRAFNVDVWPGEFLKDDTVNVPNYADFMEAIDTPPNHGGGDEFDGNMLWRCRLHPQVINKRRSQLPWECSMMAELTA